MSSKIFPIISIKRDESILVHSEINKSEICFSGNGFFISDNGLFATAEHLLKNKVGGKINDYIKFDKYLYKIETLYRYPFNPTYNGIDIAIGKINISKCDYFNPNNFSIVKIEENLVIKGFSNLLLSEKNKHLVFINKNNDIFFNIPAKCIALKYHYLDFGGIEMENFYTIKHITLYGCRKGLSGSPVLNKKNNVVGILKGGSNNSDEAQVLYCNIINKILKNEI